MSSSTKADSFGNGVPYGDPSWYQQWYSPYYNESHKKFRAYVRDWAEKNLAPHVFEWEETKKMPIKELAKKAYEDGLLPAIMGPPWPVKLIGSNIAGGLVKVEEFDAFHDIIIADEMSRVTGGGTGMLAGLSIGLPPVVNFGSEHLKQKVAVPCLKGEKIICLAITEPAAGSDVANLTCEAVKTPDGKHYIVNGEKKWITNGTYSDFFTTAVRTGGPGREGISVLLIERGEGVETKQMNCTGLWASGTAYVTFEDVKVPVENLVGVENQGFLIVMHNFNHERMGVIVEANRMSRICYEESFKYAHKRKTFGKRLIDHAVIREKLGHMIRQIEATQAIIELVAYQISKMTHEQAALQLGGFTAILKSQATRTLEYCAREASQIFGGLSYSRGGQAGLVEKILRQERAFSIFAGSEEIMLDLGVRQAMRQMKKVNSNL